MNDYVAGLDLGGSLLKAGLYDGRNNLVHETQASTPSGAGPAAILKTMLGCLRELQRCVPGHAAIVGIGIGSPGLIDAQGRVHGPAVNISGWQGTSLSQMVTSESGIPSVAGNDVNYAALAEARHRGCDELAFIALGTGIGGGIVSGGRLLTGNRGMAAEIGHVVVVPDGRPCGCGQRGCVEQYAGARVILEDRQGEERTGSTNAAPGGAGSSQGTSLQTAARMLARAIGYLLSIAAPEVVVIGGGVAERHPEMIQLVDSALEKESFPYIRNLTRVEAARLGYRAGMAGAAIAAREARPPRPAAAG